MNTEMADAVSFCREIRDCAGVKEIRIGGVLEHLRVGTNRDSEGERLVRFRVVNGRPDEKGVWRVCRYSGADEC